MSKPPMILSYDGKDVDTLNREELLEALKHLWQHHQAMMDIYKADHQMQRLFHARRV